MHAIHARARLLAPLVLVALFLFAGCGGQAVAGGGTGSTQPAPSANTTTVQLGLNNFVRTSVTVQAAQYLIFMDEQSGAQHILCFGKDGQCDTSAVGPGALKAPGMTINPGETKKVQFSANGVYHITCTIHPQMNLTVTVQG